MRSNTMFTLVRMPSWLPKRLQRILQDFMRGVRAGLIMPPADPESHTIYGSWLDGYLTPTTNGALVGYDPAQPPSKPSYMEHTIVYDGSQSAPFYYDNNSARYSEATLPLDDLTNWTLHNVTTLGIAVHGRVPSDYPAIGK